MILESDHKHDACLNQEQLTLTAFTRFSRFHTNHPNEMRPGRRRGDLLRPGHSPCAPPGTKSQLLQQLTQNTQADKLIGSSEGMGAKLCSPGTSTQHASSHKTPKRSKLSGGFEWGFRESAPQGLDDRRAKSSLAALAKTASLSSPRN